MTTKLGLTGSIGMGKSTTAGMFAAQGVPVWDADAAVHRLYRQGGAAVAPISAALPDAIIDGAVSRDALKRLISSDPSVLSTLERIVHPLVARDREAFLTEHAKAALVVFDIPLLFETGADAWLDAVLVVSAPPDVQRDRVLARGAMTEDQFNLILGRQMPDAQKRARADYVIETLTLDQTAADVRNLIETLEQKASDARNRP